jgi:hypothetical protein
VKNQPFQNGAHVIGYDTGKRITLDPKQELSVDPRSVNRIDDDMALSTICARESYLDTFEWEDAVLPLSSSIWMAPVNPGIVKRVAKGAPTPYYVAPTALSFAAAPFDVWRGDIQIRFEIVCSKYHRGKLAFYFEPNISQNVVIDTVLDMNKQFIHIIDIQETQDITFNLKWAFPRAWAKIITPGMLNDLGAVGFLGDFLFDYANGYIAVTPFTSLQSPDSSDISVNVYISSENMMFNQLIGDNLPTSRPVTESGVLSPEEITIIDLNESTATLDYITEEHYGEMPVSFRSLLKRFSRISPSLGVIGAVPPPKTISVNGLRNYPSIVPSYDGSGGDPNLYGYLRYAYIAMRGGTKRRIFIIGDATFGESNPTMISNMSPSVSYVPISASLISGSTSFAATPNGSIVFIPHVNSGIEYEVPLYSNNLFGISFSEDPFPDASIVENSVSRNHSVRIAVLGSSGNIRIETAFAVGEDFSFMGYQGAPIFQYT